MEWGKEGEVHPFEDVSYYFVEYVLENMERKTDIRDPVPQGIFCLDQFAILGASTAEQKERINGLVCLVLDTMDGQYVYENHM